MSSKQLMQFLNDYSGDTILVIAGILMLAIGVYTIRILQPNPSLITSPYEQIYYPLGYSVFLLGFTLIVSGSRDFHDDIQGKKRYKKVDTTLNDISNKMTSLGTPAPDYAPALRNIQNQLEEVKKAIADMRCALP